VGGVAVTQGVDAEFFVGARETALGFGDFDGRPHAGFGHGVGAGVEGLAK
jgi:hypothetical protein